MPIYLYKYFVHNIARYVYGIRYIHPDLEILEKLRLRDMLLLLRGFGALYVLNFLIGFLAPRFLPITYRLNYIIVGLAFLFTAFAYTVFGIYKRQNRAKK